MSPGGPIHTLKGRLAQLARSVGAIFVAVVTVGVMLILSWNPYTAFVLSVTLVFAIWASGMNLLAGYTGQLPLMFGGIAGLAAYLLLYLTETCRWPYWLALPMALTGAGMAGVLLGLPSLRLRGFYFTLSSLVVQLALTLFFVVAIPFTGGDIGRTVQVQPRLFGVSLQGRYLTYTALAILLSLTVFLSRLVRSHWGTFFRAIRDDDVLAGALGINVTLYKVVAFAIGSTVAGIGGVLYMYTVGFISPRSYDVLLSLTIWLMVGFGGRATILGPIVGAILLSPLPYLLQSVYLLRDIIYGTLVILTMLFLPEGIVGRLQRRERAESRTIQPDLSVATSMRKA